jgi:hypothetical protein
LLTRRLTSSSIICQMMLTPLNWSKNSPDLVQCNQ